MLSPQRHPLMIPVSLIALAVAAPACTTTVIGGPLDTSRPVPVDQAEPLPSVPGEAPAPDTDDARPIPVPTPDPKGTWERLDFEVLDGIQSLCGGDRYVQYAPEYGVWVGAILCSPTRYKLVMSDARDGLYLELTDWAGHGQDHCELINRSFTMPNEDDITAACPSCAIGSNFVANGPKAYTRGNFGEPFEVVSDMPRWAYQTSLFIECGVAIP